MKKIYAVALVAVFVLGMAATAFAAHLEMTDSDSTLKVNGSYRLRAESENNLSDYDDDAADHDSWYNQRLRLGLTFKVGDDVSVVTRMDILEGTWDGTAPGAAGATAAGIGVDHAYLKLKKFGLNFTIGQQPVGWGNKMWSWAKKAQRIKVAKNMDGTVVGAFTQKDREESVDGDGDADTLGLYVIVPVGDGKLSAIYVQSTDHATDIEGTQIDVAFKGKFDAIGVLAEVAMKSDDMFETAGGNDPMGYFVNVDMEISDGMNVGLTYAATSDNFTTDDDFSPTLLIGTATANGVYNLGAAAGDDDSAALIALHAKMKMGDDMNAGANLAMVTLSDTNEEEFMEIDLWMDYNLATNTKVFVGYAYGMPDVAAGSDDPFTTAAIELVTKF